MGIVEKFEREMLIHEARESEWLREMEIIRDDFSDFMEKLKTAKKNVSVFDLKYFVDDLYDRLKEANEDFDDDGEDDFMQFFWDLIIEVFGMDKAQKLA